MIASLRRVCSDQRYITEPPEHHQEDGTPADAGIEEAIADTILTIVGSVQGDWAQDVAQKADAGILPSLPDIVGVVSLTSKPTEAR